MPQTLKSCLLPTPVTLQSPTTKPIQTLTVLTASLSASSDAAISFGGLALSALLRPTASGFVRSLMESEADMAATPGTASEGPGASMAEPCGGGLWARPSWHGPRRTAEARAPLGSLCRQDWRLVSPGSRSCEGVPGRKCSEELLHGTRTPEPKPRRCREASPREFCYRTWNCFFKGFSNCSCRGNPRGRMTNPTVKEARKTGLD